ncbi:MAG: hypothetical protein CM1200mP13_10940 [Candidatus Pelagibacterales bacterium]|nr:MAG: hypothetical protein CM1200mP13_10940 [Pelagibacterales bacterium]
MTCTGYKREHPNVSNYAARFYEGRTILGTIAGTMTKSNVIGYVASFPIPEVIRGINSFTLALKKLTQISKLKLFGLSLGTIQVKKQKQQKL